MHTVQDIKSQIAFLNETLIPDLIDSDHIETAKDFSLCVDMLEQLLARIDSASDPLRDLRQTLNMLIQDTFVPGIEANERTISRKVCETAHDAVKQWREVARPLGVEF